MALYRLNQNKLLVLPGSPQRLVRIERVKVLPNHVRRGHALVMCKPGIVSACEVRAPVMMTSAQLVSIPISSRSLDSASRPRFLPARRVPAPAQHPNLFDRPQSDGL